MKHKSPASHACDHAVAEDWEERLRAKAGRVTKTRRLIIEALARLQRPSTPKQVVAAVAEERCDPATVYRSMTLFEEVGIVRRVDFGDGLARFEIADADPLGHHHHHLVCRECGRIVKIDDCILSEMDERLGRQYGFRKITHRLEFVGICVECSSDTDCP